MARVEVPDPDWYLDNVIVPSGIERGQLGPARAWQGSWPALAHRLRESADDSAVGRATRTALGQGFVLTQPQLRDCGVTDAERRRLVRRGDWTACGRGAIAVVPAPAPDAEPHGSRRRIHTLHAAAAVVKRRDHTIALSSAAIGHGLPTFDIPPRPELYGGPTATFGRLESVHVRRARLEPGDRDDWFGVPIVTVARAVADLARLDPRSGLMAADAALHEGLVRGSDIDDVLARSAALRGVARAREVLQLASPKIESPLESITHLALHDDGFPPPQLQQWVKGADGKRYRVDFVWPELRVILEADGRSKYTGDTEWKEKAREIALVRAGYLVVRVRWVDVVADWPATAAWLRRQLAQQSV